jgi:iron complex outermembrane receptor protein
LSIEELLELDVSLPLRRQDRVMDVPAAIVVLTGEDLRRQGAVSLPEALRTVPGLFVGRFSGSSWIISSRGFASTSANKLLVMIDGRSVYSPLFSGVFWNQQDTLLNDVDRVEVIRGPGASLWGSNAVNGVINVVSKSATATQGTLVTLGAGAEEQLQAGIRHGGRLGSAAYRVYGKFFERDAADLADGADAQDGQRLGQGGFRLDREYSTSAVTLQGDIYRTDVDTPSPVDIEASGANLLARWTRRPPSGRAEFQLQAFFDRTHRAVPNQAEETRNTIDVDANQRLAVSARHALNAGGSYRYSADETVASPLLAFEPADRGTHLLTAFVQDEFSITPKVLLVGGLKLEHNDYTGVEWQPTARARWMPGRSQTLWGAVSRAVRMPTRFDTDIRVFQGQALVATGSSDFASETVTAYESGYRVAPTRSLAFDVTLFRNHYDNLRTQEFRGGRIIVGNRLNDSSTGATIVATLQPRPWARVTGSYTHLRHDLSLDPGSTDIYRGLFETIDPRHLGRVTARFDLPSRVELDLMTMFVASLPQIVPAVPGTPAFGEAGFRLAWRATDRLEAAVIGRDLLHGRHVEFVSPTSSRITALERALSTRLTFVF